MDHTMTLWRAWQHSQGLSDRTITERAITIARLCRDAGVDDPTRLTPAHIIAFTGRRDVSDVTRASYHASIRAFFAFALRSGLAEEDPSARTPRPKRPKYQPRPVESSQLAALLSTCNRRRTRAYVLLAALQGLRVHEVAKIRGEDFDLNAGTLTVSGKGGKVAVLPVHEKVAALARSMPSEGYWFPSYKGNAGHVSRQAVTAAISAAMRRAGVRATPHALRHWYATALLSAGNDLRVVQTLLRHESPSTTALYTRVDYQAQLAGIARLDLPDAA